MWRNLFFLSITGANVSIHTPTQGVTLIKLRIASILSFNPHTHAGCDIAARAWAIEARAVSIHTPTQGVTALMPNWAAIWSVSIHTPTQGVTNGPIVIVWQELFQSTHPRRVWHSITTSSFFFNCFNPHTHAGCDPDSIKSVSYQLVSIHTPTQGVTYRNRTNNPHYMFQSTHPRRVWQMHGSVLTHSVVSIHTPTQGVTQARASMINAEQFQSTHPRRVWLWSTWHASCSRSVSIHTPTQGVTLWLYYL